MADERRVGAAIAKPATNAPSGLPSADKVTGSEVLQAVRWMARMVSAPFNVVFAVGRFCRDCAMR